MLGVTVGGVGAQAGAAERAGDPDALRELINISVLGTVATDTRTGATVETGLTPLMQTVDAVTGAVLGQASVPLKLRTSAPAGGSPQANCAIRGDSKNVRVYDVVNRYLSGKGGTVHFQYHRTMYRNARKVDARSMTQFEVCSAGGGDLGNGFRAVKMGTGMAIQDSTNFLKIGSGWREGKTPKDYTLNMGFEVAPKQLPVSLDGSVSQTPQDKLKGSIRAPHDSFMNTWDRNAVNAWWEDSCIGSWRGCWGRSGSTDYQGTVAHGLWEYQTAALPPVVYFAFTPYITVCRGIVSC